LEENYTGEVRFYGKKKCCRKEKQNLLFITYGYFRYLENLLGVPAKMLGPQADALRLEFPGPKGLELNSFRPWHQLRNESQWLNAIMKLN